MPLFSLLSINFLELAFIYSLLQRAFLSLLSHQLESGIFTIFKLIFHHKYQNKIFYILVSMDSWYQESNQVYMHTKIGL